MEVDRGPRDDVFWENLSYTDTPNDSGFYVAHDAGESDDLKGLVRADLISSDNVELEIDPLQLALPKIFYHWQLQEYLLGKAQTTTADSASPYRKTVKNEIRVYELNPGEPSDPLSGRLMYIDIEFQYQRRQQSHEIKYMRQAYYGIALDELRKVSYTAVSYCWGPAQFTHSLTASEHTIDITPTVDVFLRALRHREHPVRVWIDQICINQKDPSDKEAQVQLMGMIYARAENTIIWLGDGPEAGAFSLMKDLSQAVYGTPEDLSEEQLGFLKRIVDQRPEAFQSIFDLFRQPWFQRTWVVQEAILPQATFLMLGGVSIPWNDFARYCMDMLNFDIFALSGRSAEGDFNSGWEIISRIQSARDMYKIMGHDQLSLYYWLEVTRYAAVTVPLDKVYGVMGLCSQVVPIDYSVKVDSLFAKVAIHIWQTEGLQRLFSSIDHQQTGNGLASWMTDWTLQRVTTPLAKDNFCSAYCKAGGKAAVPESSMMDDNRTLKINGVHIDTVSNVSEVMLEADLLAVKSHQANASLRQAIQFIKMCHASTDDIDFGTFCATLVAGRDGSGMSAIPRGYIEVLSLLCDEVTEESPALPGQPYTTRQKKGFFTLTHLSKRNPGRTFQDLRKAYRNAMLNRRLAWTEHGIMALVPRFCLTGDRLVAIPGLPVPYAMRQQLDGEYILMGESYMHDVMDGKWFEANRNNLEDMHIV